MSDPRARLQLTRVPRAIEPRIGRTLMSHEAIASAIEQHIEDLRGYGYDVSQIQVCVHPDDAFAELKRVALRLGVQFKVDENAPRGTAYVLPPN